MNELEKQIEGWSSSLAERLVEIRFIDIDDMKAAMTAHLKSAMMDCLKIQLSDTEKLLIDKKLHYANYGGGRNNHIQSEILSLKRKFKEQNELYAKLDRDNLARELIMWMRKNHEPALLEFYKLYNGKKPNSEQNPERSVATKMP